jgi:hypothetical protein
VPRADAAQRPQGHTEGPFLHSTRRAGRQGQATDGADASLRAYAEQVLPKLRDHLARARSLYE